MKVRAAAVQAETYYDEEWRNVDLCLKYIDEAGEKGVELLCFPEGYPGPYSGPMDFAGKVQFDVLEAICDRAKKNRLFVTVCYLEENPEIDGTFFLVQKLISNRGEVLANYKRFQPDHQYLNAYLMGGRRHILPGDEITVVETEIGRIGLQICSELWVPEISRIQMLKGADIIVAPFGGHYKVTHFKDKQYTWHCIARARAAENIVYVIVAQSIYDLALEHQEISEGEAKTTLIIAGPEKTIATSPPKFGLVIADLDMDRLNHLRGSYYSEELLSTPKDLNNYVSCATRPGQCHDRRPQDYGALVAPQPDAFDYHYHRRGLDAWKENFEKVAEFQNSDRTETPQPTTSKV
ncbi:MAG: carbon-nitrogen hydrolase family protein [Nitrospinota bacterium]